MTTQWHLEMRNKNRDEIIHSAQELFLELDVSGVGIKDICAKAGVSRVTFYKYFNSIDELAFEVQIKVMDEMNSYMNEHVTLNGSGREKLEALLSAWAEFAKQHPNHFKYIGYFDHHYRDRYPNEELAERYRQSIDKSRGEFPLSVLLREGISDGSIRRDLNVNEVGATIYETMLSLLQRMTSRGEIIKKEHQIETSAIVKTALSMVLRYVQ
ncbi:AcrR family transcriptional regulator [Paenibacillus phyllosphaerae]|uniref:AcrR family transcriptional regulator n=1 Tax=Paenibacillus phyllosphaerae TaxID=274593 RepID=A0A7W5FR53_9BACL|nr:TetR/AcrR family transcriptional regulator [Paenibacillus phyllosphaerae]MBB3114160.1 AcrR family transcriptional regulator [Paenibacillus phyllosphaerae]